MDKNVIEKYLKNYAEDEINYIPNINKTWDNVISIPCYNEYEEIIDLLENNLPSIVKNTLVILNINANQDSESQVFSNNIRLINYLKSKSNINNDNLLNFLEFQEF